MSTYTVIIDPKKSIDIPGTYPPVSIGGVLTGLATDPRNSDDSVTFPVSSGVTITIPASNILAVLETTA